MLYSFLHHVSKNQRVSMQIMYKIIPSRKGITGGGKHAIVYCIPYFRNSTYTHLQTPIQS